MDSVDSYGFLWIRFLGSPMDSYESFPMDSYEFLEIPKTATAASTKRLAVVGLATHVAPQALAFALPAEPPRAGHQLAVVAVHNAAQDAAECATIKSALSTIPTMPAPGP